MLSRTLDPATLNRVANHPEVFPWLGATCPMGELDLSFLVSDPANVTMAGAHGGFIAQKPMPGRYEVHSLFEPEGRGSDLVKATADGLRYLFAATDALEVLTKVPANNPRAAGLARAAGFQQVFSRPSVWPCAEGRCDVSYQTVTLDRWISRDDQVRAEGERFHDALEAAKAASGSARVVHDDDEAHDRAVGATALMLKAGNAEKAIWSYNRWATFAGYAPVELVSRNPLIIDVVDALVEVRDGAMEVLQCR